jgi:hypothetical protein
MKGEHSERWLSAYYYGFGPTGAFPVDVILSAVARAGKAFHSTADWNDETACVYEPGIHRGATPIEWIENAAADAASEFSSMLDSLHFCALAEDRVRGRHRKYHRSDGSFGCVLCMDDLGFSLDWPCPTLNDIIGEVPRG